MESKIKFNHNAEQLTEALGINMTAEQVSEKIIQCLVQWRNSKDNTKNSNLAEYLHNEIDYEIILFLATNDLLQQVAKSIELSPIDKIMQMLDDIEMGKFKDN